MLIYNINLFVVYISLLLSRYLYIQKKNNIASKILNLIMFISICTISGLRYNVGTDYQAYVDIFSNINSYDFSNSQYEVGYVILNKLTRFITNNDQMIFIVTSFIILFFISRTVCKYSSRPEMSMFLFITLYFYYSSFNIVRQYIAIAIMFYGVRYILNRNFKRYIGCIIIALLFHTTAIYALPIYFLPNKRLNNKVLIKSIIISIGVLILINPIFKIITVVFPRYEYYGGGVLFNRGTYRSIIIIGSIFFISYIYRYRIINIDKKNNLYINAMFIAFIISIVGIKSVLFIRIVSYFSLYSILLIPNFIDIFEQKSKPIVYLLIISISYIYCYILLSINDGGVLPYMFRII